MYDGITRIETRWQKVEAESPSQRRKRRQEDTPANPKAPKKKTSPASFDEESSVHIDVTV